MRFYTVLVSNYDYFFIIKELAEEFKGQFTCLGENAEKYISFSVLIEKKLKEFVKMERNCKNHILKLYFKLYDLC